MAITITAQNPGELAADLKALGFHQHASVAEKRYNDTINELDGELKAAQFALRDEKQAREDALKTAHAAAGRLADIAEVVEFKGNPGDLVAHVAIVMANAARREAALEAELRRAYDVAGIPAEQRLTLDTPSPSGVVACSVPEEAPAELAASSPEKPSRNGKSDARFTVKKDEEEGGWGVFDTETSQWVMGYSLKREAKAHADELNARGEKTQEPPAETHQPGPAPPLTGAEAPEAQGIEEWTAPLTRGTRVKVDTVGFAGYGVIVQQARIGQDVRQSDGYVVETQSGKHVMALWSACVEAPLPPAEEPPVEEPAAEEPQVDAELADLREQLEQHPAATLTPDEPVIILIEDSKRLETGVLVRQFEGTNRYTVKKDGGGMEVLDASLIRRYTQAPAQAAEEAPPWEGDEPQTDDAGDGDRLVTPEERAELGAFAKSKGVVPARISALIAKHFSKDHSSKLMLSELAELRAHIEAEAAAHVF